MKNRWYVVRCDENGQELINGIYIAADDISMTSEGDISFIEISDNGTSTVVAIIHRNFWLEVHLEPEPGENYVEVVSPGVGGRKSGTSIPVGSE